MTVERIIEGCKRGDAEAMRELYDRYAGLMFGVLCRYVRQRSVAEDLLHDGFVTVFTKVTDFRGEGSFEGWMRRVFVTTALGYLRKKNPLWKAEAVEELRKPDDSYADAVEEMSAAEVAACIGRLPDGYRTILNLYAVEGYSHAEIASHLGISENTSRSQYSRARGRLAELIAEQNRERIVKKQNG